MSSVIFRFPWLNNYAQLSTSQIPFIVLVSILSLPVLAQSPAAGSGDELSRAVALYKSGDYKGAVDILKDAVKKQKENADAWYYLALAHLLKGDAVSSRKSFEKAIKLRPDHSGSHSGLSYVLFLFDDFKNAEKEAEKAI
jgi:Flp pilus assembly protein TadD